MLGPLNFLIFESLFGLDYLLVSQASFFNYEIYSRLPTSL